MKDSDIVWSFFLFFIEVLKKFFLSGVKLIMGWMFKCYLLLDNFILYLEGVDYIFVEDEVVAFIRVFNGE